MASIRRWQDLASPDFSHLDRDRTVALLPAGATEQHGPHLPVSVDALIAREICARAFTHLPDDHAVLLLPASDIGKSNEHIDFPGTLTLSAETLTRLWFEIGQSVARAGVRKLVFLNSHGGQPQVMEIVARDLRVRERMMAVTAGWWHLGTPKDLFGAAEARHGIHAGAVETSMMLALAPDLVRMDRAENFVPVMAATEEDHDRLSWLGGVGIGWKAEDIHPAGAAGNALAADADKGRQIVDAAARGLARLLEEVSAYPLGFLDGRGGGEPSG